MSKSNLGQFYTTNYKYILKKFTIPSNITNIIEPFAGQGDLLNIVKDKKITLECYDIEPKQDYIKKRDTLLNPPVYKNKFVLTNPPYLARNKSNNKTIFNKYNTNDLYKCFLEELIINQPIGGIIIIPLNFWSSIRISDISLRQRFLTIFNVLKVNIFEEQVFNDTSYTVCSFQFELGKNDKPIKFNIYPSRKHIEITLNNQNKYIIGGKIYKLYHNNNIIIDRLTHLNEYQNKKYITNILVKCIDNNEKNQIQMIYVDENKRYIDNTHALTARAYCTLIIKPAVNVDEQKKLVNKFNSLLNKYRQKYHSLFLANYREDSRKRISFNLVYRITNYLISKISTNDKSHK